MDSLLQHTPYIIHGSKDSIDKDAFFILSNNFLIGNNQECKELCEELSTYFGFNGNLVTVYDGIVTQCYKGIVDEVNNGMLNTFHLHEQKYQLPVWLRVERHVERKVLRTIRGILSMHSRTCLRNEIKQALRSASLLDKMEVLNKIDFQNGYDYSDKGTLEDIYKFFAFQLTQTCALINGTEIFTKNEASNLYPYMSCYLYRNPTIMNLDIMNGLILKIISYCSKILGDDPTIINTKFGKLSVKTENYI